MSVAGGMLFSWGGVATSGAGLFLNLFLFLPFRYGYSNVSNSPPPDRTILLIPSLNHLHPKVRYLKSKAQDIIFIACITVIRLLWPPFFPISSFPFTLFFPTTQPGVVKNSHSCASFLFFLFL